jgi:hypothetical protein
MRGRGLWNRLRTMPEITLPETRLPGERPADFLPPVRNQRTNRRPGPAGIGPVGINPPGIGPAPGTLARPLEQVDGFHFQLARITWSCVPVASFGYLTPLPFLCRAVLGGRQRDWQVFAAYTVLTVLSVYLMVSADRSSLLMGLGLSLWLATTLGGAAHTFATFRTSGCSPGRSLGRTPAGPPNRDGRARPAANVTRSNRRAVRKVRAERRRRSTAKRLAHRDPALARELGIGRPSRVRDYNDGGLVDLNHAVERELVTDLGLSRAEAAAVLRAREELGGRFESVQELAAFGALGPHRVDEITERAFCL